MSRAAGALCCMAQLGACYETNVRLGAATTQLWCLIRAHGSNASRSRLIIIYYSIVALVQLVEREMSRANIVCMR